jgi:hypothetical protein
MALGHVPASFRKFGNELQLVADQRRLYPSDVNHPEQVISRFKILVRNCRHDHGERRERLFVYCEHDGYEKERGEGSLGALFGIRSTKGITFSKNPAWFFPMVLS